MSLDRPGLDCVCHGFANKHYGRNAQSYVVIIMFSLLLLLLLLCSRCVVVIMFSLLLLLLLLILLLLFFFALVLLSLVVVVRVWSRPPAPLSRKRTRLPALEKTNPTPRTRKKNRQRLV